MTSGGLFRALFVHPYNLGLGLLTVASVEDGNYRLGQVDEGQSRGGFAAEGGGSALVATVADALYERYLSQQGYLHLLG